jgi:hypothetical protein
MLLTVSYLKDEFMTEITSTSRFKLIAYRIFTGILLLQTVAGAVLDLSRNKAFADAASHLGYPSYLLSILGTLRIAAFITILVPESDVLKEWAYAGLFFEFVVACMSHIAVGDSAAQWVSPLIFAMITFASWVLRPSSRKPVFKQSTTCTK